MKKLFGKHLDLIEANQVIAVLEKDLEATTTERDQLRTDIETLKGFQKTELENLETTHKAALAASENQINDLTQKVNELEKSKVSAAQQAANIVANLGVEAPVEKPTATTPSTDKTTAELWAEYNAITDHKERRAFYLENIKPQL